MLRPLMALPKELIADFALCKYLGTVFGRGAAQWGKSGRVTRLSGWRAMDHRLKHIQAMMVETVKIHYLLRREFQTIACA